MGCKEECAKGKHICCFECEEYEECFKWGIECNQLDDYEFIENCPSYFKEEER